MRLQMKIKATKQLNDLMMQFITQEVAIIHFELLDEFNKAFDPSIPHANFTKKFADLLRELRGDRGRLTKYFEAITKNGGDPLYISQYVLQSVRDAEFEYPIEIVNGKYLNAIQPMNLCDKDCVVWCQKDLTSKTFETDKFDIKMIIKAPSAQTKGEENVFYRD